MRSVVVVFPASMWAMMPMLRIWSSGVVRGIALPYSAKTRGDQAPTVGRSRSARTPRQRRGVNPPLPAIVGEGPVGLGHPVRVFFLLYGLALALRGEDQLGGQPLRHVLLAPGAAERDQPAHAKRRAPLGPHFYRYLIRRTTHAARLHLERRLHVRQRLLEHVHTGQPGVNVFKQALSNVKPALEVKSRRQRLLAP